MNNTMRYMTRKELMERLKLSLTATYRIIGTTRTRLKLISSKDVVAILNSARRGGQPLLLELPDDLLTCEEMAAELHGVTARDLYNWTHRTLKVPPHFLLTTHCRRFRRSEVLRWLDEHTKIVRRTY